MAKFVDEGVGVQPVLLAVITGYERVHTSDGVGAACEGLVHATRAAMPSVGVPGTDQVLVVGMDNADVDVALDGGGRPGHDVLHLPLGGAPTAHRLRR